MTSFAMFAGKEFREIVSSWRIWVLPGLVLFFALTGPPLAKFTPQILAAAVGDQIAGIKLPPPTYVDSYAQWVKNLSQIVMIALVIAYGGLVSNETKSGTAVLVLTKPLSRTAFVVAKVAVHAIFLMAVVIVGTLTTWGLTSVIFGMAPSERLWEASFTWLVLGVMFIGLMTVLSVEIKSAAGAAGAGVGAFALLAIATIWAPLGKYSPAALTSLPASLVRGDSVAVGWPLTTSLFCAVLLVVLAAWRFERKDI
jgi:ABC-2 type transport system permease protein